MLPIQSKPLGPVHSLKGWHAVSAEVFATIAVLGSVRERHGSQNDLALRILRSWDHC
jgi:hypothetical protein